jgi:hypothetical protein
MKKLQITYCLMLILAIAAPANGMMRWLNQFDFWQTTQTQQPVNPPAQTNNQSVAPSTLNQKKRTAAQAEIIDLSQDDSDDEGESEIRLEEKTMLKQDDGYSCGLYAFFHYLALKNNYLQEEDLLKSAYNDFKKDVYAQFPGIAEKNRIGQYLSGDDLRILLNYFNPGANKDCIIPSLISNTTQLPVITTDFDIINSIKTNHQIFWVIIHMTDPYEHWLCLEVNKNNHSYVYYDSLTPQRSRTQIKTRNAVLAMTRFFSGEIKLPSKENYQNLVIALGIAIRTANPNIAIAAVQEQFPTITENVFALVLGEEQKLLVPNIQINTNGDLVQDLTSNFKDDSD